MQPTRSAHGILGRVTVRTNRGDLTRRATPLRTLAVGAALSALVLAGCSDDPEVEDPPTASEESPTTDDDAAESTTTDDAAPTTEPGDDAAVTSEPVDDEPTTEAPSGPVTSADGAFTVTPLPGWLDVTDQVEQEVELALRAGERSDNFFTNLVVASEDPIGDLEQSIEAAAEQVAGADGEYELIHPIEIDGEEAYGFILTRTTSGVEVSQTQYWVEHDDRLYVATFSAALSQQEATEPAMQDLLDSWAWED